MYGTIVVPVLHVPVLVLLLVPLVQQLNCRLRFLEIKILLYPLRLLLNVGDNLLVEFDAPCINLLVIFHNVTSRLLIFQSATSQML